MTTTPQQIEEMFHIAFLAAGWEYLDDVEGGMEFGREDPDCTAQDRIVVGLPQGTWTHIAGEDEVLARGDVNTIVAYLKGV